MVREEHIAEQNVNLLPRVEVGIAKGKWTQSGRCDYSQFGQATCLGSVRATLPRIGR
jgi:hypothetical protein